jgi:hypothetical protein
MSAAADDGDIFQGNEPERFKQYLDFQEVGGWASFGIAGIFLAVQLCWMPETRRQMRPRMLLILLAFDTFSGFFFGLCDAPVIYLSHKYDNVNETTNLGYVTYGLA